MAINQTTAQSIIDAIDAAILAWAGEPIALTIAGRTTTYRSLTELYDVRSNYEKLLQTAGGTVGVQFHRLAAEGAT